MLTEPRKNYKPFEYPEVRQFIDSINSSFWVHSEVDFAADIQDFHSNLNSTEKEVIKRSLLGIAQIEVAVKLFWGNLYQHFPKPEINGLGATFAECEWRHSEAYSRLLEVLGYNDEFIEALNDPIFANRNDYATLNLDDKNIVHKLMFFVIVTENASLFSQFANILSFTRFKGLMKNVSNIIAWTSIDEDTHANAGIYLINKLREEGLFTENDAELCRQFVQEYVKKESDFLDWIYEKGELDFFTKDDALNFVKYRIDKALKQMSIETVFNVTNEQYEKMKWFDEDVFANELDDFFAKKPTAYTKHDKPITSKDLF